MTLYTIGFTQKTAQDFFDVLAKSGVKRVLDIRLNNVSQLAGFTKKNDLQFFLQSICGIDYIHLPILAPSQDILNEYRKFKGPWSDYERKFLSLLEQRDIKNKINRELLSDACLLCSEPKATYCHRRLTADYFKGIWSDLEIHNL